MDVPGNASVTDTSHSTRFVSVAKRKVGLCLLKKYIILFQFQKAAHTQEKTLNPYAVHATQKSITKLVTGNTPGAGKIFGTFLFGQRPGVTCAKSQKF